MNIDRFRVKAKNILGEWVYAEPYEDEDGAGLGLAWKRPEGRFLYHPIIKKTVSQCTGLRDSVGNLIYENDIVRVVDRDYTVVYHEPSMSYEINGETDDRDFSTLVCWVKHGIKCVVIGNKFDKEENESQNHA